MNQLDILWQLQKVDLDLDETGKRLREVESRLGESQELVRARESVREMEASLHDQQVHLRDLELELNGLSSKVKATEDRLYGGRVTNPKELSSLQQDLQYLKRKQGELEDSALLAMTEMDDQKAALQARRRELEQVEGSWSREQADLEKSGGELKGQIEGLAARRVELTAALDKGNLQIYEELRRKKGGRAVSHLSGDLCEGCRVAIPTSRVQIVKRKAELVFCGGCGRILYSG